MPRTKRVSKKRNYSNASTKSRSSSSKLSLKSNGNELIIADINRQFDKQLLKLDKELEKSIELLRNRYELGKLQIPKSAWDAPYREIVNYLPGFSPEVTSTVDHVSPEQAQFSHETKAAKEAFNKPCTVNSSKDSGHGDEPSTMLPPTLSRFRTPACNVGVGGKYNVITPKVQPNSVLSVLRRPREGEMALSMSGSPLLVSAITHESVANVNVPLPNGSVMSILPQAGVRPHDLPNMDPETYQQLKQLKDNLASLLNEQF